MAATPEHTPLSQGARDVLTRAESQARRFNHNYIGTEHLLLGLVTGNPDDLATLVLTNLGVNSEKISRGVEFIIGRGERYLDPDLGIGPTPRAKKVIQLAEEELRRDRPYHPTTPNEVTSLHLLRGLVREGKGIAAGVLESLGVSLEKVRQEANRLQIEQEQPEEQVYPAAETVRKLQEVFENPNISQRTKTFIMGLLDKITDYALQEDTSESDTTQI
jgi:ATP-dependent Clp protease ATP-binding subunit ClpC